jgi:hypothetical protein
MRTLVRYTIVLTMVATLGVTLALPAVAGQRISYRGRSSQDDRIQLTILKRDSGRRFLSRSLFYITLTCEDASTETFGIGGFGDAQRLGDDGSFGVHELYPGIFGLAIDIDGVVRWGSAEGTLELSAAALTDDGDAQFCTTGLVDWTADRVGSRPARPLPAPDGVTMLKFDREGELRLIEP